MGCDWAVNVIPPKKPLAPFLLSPVYFVILKTPPQKKILAPFSLLKLSNLLNPVYLCPYLPINLVKIFVFGFQGNKAPVLAFILAFPFSLKNASGPVFLKPLHLSKLRPLPIMITHTHTKISFLPSPGMEIAGRFFSPVLSCGFHGDKELFLILAILLLWRIWVILATSQHLPLNLQSCLTQASFNCQLEGNKTRRSGCGSSLGQRKADEAHMNRFKLRRSAHLQGRQTQNRGERRVWS